MRKKLTFQILAVFYNTDSASAGLYILEYQFRKYFISLNDIFQILFHKNGDETAYNIVWEIRLPRILAAVILEEHFQYQGFFCRHFLETRSAGPFVLGISSGAKLIVALTMIYLLGKSMVATSGLMIHGCVYRISDIHGICAFDLTKGKADVHACCKWYYDWIYLFCDNRFCGYFCR